MNGGDADQALLRLGAYLQALGYRHITVTPATHARVNARPQNGWAQDLNGVLGWSRPFQSDLLAPALFDLMSQAGILEKSGTAWRSRLRVSSLGEDLFFHSAWPTEAEDAVFFGPDSYRYVSALLQYCSMPGERVQRVVDIGCGSGVGAITLARCLPDAEVYALDINPAALRLTRMNASLAGVALQIQYSNLLNDVEGDFDLIIANPPYMLDGAERTYRHGGGNLGDGLSLAIVDAALKRLRPGGHLLLYTGAAVVSGVDSFYQAVSHRLKHACVWHYHELDPDVFGEMLTNEAYADVERIAVVLLQLTLGAAA